MKRSLLRSSPALWTLGMLLLAAPWVAYGIETGYGVPLTSEHLRFQRPWAALLLPAALLVLWVRGWLDTRRRPRLRMSRAADLAQAGRGWRTWFKDSPTGLRVTAVLLLVLALMGPQSIHARDATDIDGIDIVVTLDMSLSMQAADIKPDRFRAAQAVIDDFVRRRRNDRLGAVVFGRDAFTLLPLTTDHEALRSLIAELELNMIEGRGTAIGNAIGVALNRLRNSEAKSKVIILLTDGDSNSGNVTPLQAAEFARTMGVQMYTVLMGQTSDAPVQQGFDLFGRPIFDRGTFPVNPELLRKVADSTGGQAYVASDREGLERSFHDILDKLERSQMQDAGKVYGELMAAFAWPALALLVLELLMGTLVLRRWP